MRLNKHEKAKKLLDGNGVLFLGRRYQKAYFIVKGKVRKHYDVTLDFTARMPKNHCSCDYFKANDCSHIIAAKLFSELENG